MDTIYAQGIFMNKFGISHVKIQLTEAVSAISEICEKYKTCNTRLEGMPINIGEGGVTFRLHKAKETDTFMIPYDKMAKVTKMDY